MLQRNLKKIVNEELYLNRFLSNFVSENKSIEDILNQPNITFKEKRRHGGSTFKIIEKDDANNQLVNNDLSENNTENLEPIATNLTNNEKEQETNKIVVK